MVALGSLVDNCSVGSLESQRNEDGLEGVAEKGF